MATVVMKFGGSSVEGPERINRVADRVCLAQDAGDSVVVVVSAPGDMTDELNAMAYAINPHPPKREMDMLLSTGERISIALLSMAMEMRGHHAISFTGSQAGIVTDTVHTKARITDVRAHRIEEELAEGSIVIVAGFQGVSTENDVTTLGRGGSDTTAVALAAALHADRCEIFTDVDGVFTADPRIVPEARKLHRLSYEEMLEMSASGAKVLALRSVEFARNHGVVIHCRSTFNDAEGTWINEGEEGMEQALISGVTHNVDEAKVTIQRVPDRPGIAARVFSALAEANVNVDAIIQNTGRDGLADISFTIDRGDLAATKQTIEREAAELGASGCLFDDDIAKVSVIGAGMKSNPGVAAKMFSTLAEKGINIDMINTSAIRISCIIAREQTDEAVRALHAAFNLEDGA